MKTGNDAVVAAVDQLLAVDTPFMLVGAYSSNYYGIPRATKDADFVVVLSKSIMELANALGDAFELEPQSSFERITGTFRDIFHVPSIPFIIEVFHLSEDDHDKKRFERRVSVFDELLQRDVSIPTPEDVVITKLRWEKIGERGKDANDVRDVIAVQGDDLLDWGYIYQWTNEHQTTALLDEIRASIPPID